MREHYEEQSSRGAVAKGRIWRVVYGTAATRRGPAPHLSTATPAQLVQTLAKLIKDKKPERMTVRRFTHEVAKRGGFMARKSDGEPGWRTLWQGWHELSLIHAGYELAQKAMRCG